MNIKFIICIFLACIFLFCVQNKSVSAYDNPFDIKPTQGGTNYLSLFETFNHLFGTSTGEQIQQISSKYPEGTYCIVKVAATGIGDKPDLDRMARYQTSKPFFDKMLMYDKVYVSEMGFASKFPQISELNKPYRFNNLLEPVPRNQHLIDVVYIKVNGTGSKEKLVAQKLKIIPSSTASYEQGGTYKFGLYAELNNEWKGNIDPALAMWRVANTVPTWNAEGKQINVPPGSISKGIFTATYPGKVVIQAKKNNAIGTYSFLVKQKDDQAQEKRKEGQIVNIPLNPSEWEHLTHYKGAIYSTGAGLVLKGEPWTNGRIKKDGYTDGNAVQTKEKFDLSNGGEVIMKFKIQGAGKYLNMFPRIFSSASYKLATTHHSFMNSIVLPENQWLYARFILKPDKRFKTTISQYNYDFDGGKVLLNHYGNVSSKDGTVCFIFGDNYAGIQQSITIGEAAVYIKD